MVSEPITTDALIEARMDETGLTREQLLLVVAKSALVRHLATGPDKGRFVLKGIDDITIARRGRGNALDISMSVRSGECLDGPLLLTYTDTMLARDSRFLVLGLSLEELAAEKVLGWATKDQSRHYIDLAYIARDYGSELDAGKAAKLICEKFAREAHGGRYRRIPNVGQLASTFSAPARVKRIRDSWRNDLGTRVLFLHEEEDRPAGSLADFANVERYANEVWVPILDEAARTASRRSR